MHEKCFQDNRSKSTELRPKVIGFQSILPKILENLNEKVVSVSRIGPRFSVQSHNNKKFNWGCIDNMSLLVYVDVKAADEKYALGSYTNEFGSV